jgi:hypothetical protein
MPSNEIRPPYYEAHKINQAVTKFHIIYMTNNHECVLL